MADTRQLPADVDPTRPSSARIYDYLLGGQNSFEVDRVAAERMKAQIPEVIDTAWANRGFHQRAARWIAEQGVRQFIDIGAGLPTVGNTHEVVRRVQPEARVVYADNDPTVLAHGGELLGHDPLATVILADLRDPDELLGNAELRGLIDFAEPTGLLMTAVVHFVSDESNPQALIARYMSELADGSYLALSHRTDDHKPPIAVSTLSMVGQQAAGGSFYQSKDEVRGLFGGLRIVPPYEGAEADVTWGSRWLYCGVASKDS